MCVCVHDGGTEVITHVEITGQLYRVASLLLSLVGL